LTGVWNQLAMLAFPTVALVLLTLTGDAHAALDTVAYLGLAIFAVVIAAFAAGLSTPSLARAIGDSAARIASWALRLVRKQPVEWSGESFVRFRDRTNHLLKRRWHVLTLATVAGHLTVFLVLLASLRVLDVSASEVSAVEAFAAWALVRLLGSIPITPGGLGVVELGLTTALVGFGGNQVEVVAAVLVYRFLTIVPTLVIGLVAGATWKRYRPDDLPTDAPPASGPTYPPTTHSQAQRVRLSEVEGLNACHPFGLEPFHQYGRIFALPPGGAAPFQKPRRGDLFAHDGIHATICVAPGGVCRRTLPRGRTRGTPGCEGRAG
jgi:hypothetical protein